MKKLYFFVILVFFAHSHAQIGVGTIEPKASLDVIGQPTDVAIADGIIAPRLTREQLISKTAYGLEQSGAIVYITDLSGTTNSETADLISTGYYFYNGTKWIAIANDSGSPRIFWTNSRIPGTIYDNFSLTGNTINATNLADGTLVISKAGFAIFIKNGSKFELVNQDKSVIAKNTSTNALNGGELVYFLRNDATNSGVKSINDSSFLTEILNQPTLGIVRKEIIAADGSVATSNLVSIVTESPSVILKCSEGQVNDDLYLMDGEFVTSRPTQVSYYYIGKILEVIDATHVRVQFFPKFYDLTSFSELILNSNDGSLNLYSAETVNEFSTFIVTQNSTDGFCNFPFIINLYKNINVILSTDSTHNLTINATNGTVKLVPGDRIQLFINNGLVYLEKDLNSKVFWTPSRVPNLIYDNFELSGAPIDFLDLPEGALIFTKGGNETYIKNNSKLYLQYQEKSLVAKNISSGSLNVSELVFLSNASSPSTQVGDLNLDMAGWGVKPIVGSAYATNIVNEPKLAIIRSSVVGSDTTINPNGFVTVVTESPSIIIKNNGIGVLHQDLYLVGEQFDIVRPNYGQYYYLGKIIEVVDLNHVRIQFFPKFYDLTGLKTKSLQGLATTYQIDNADIEINNVFSIRQLANDTNVTFSSTIPAAISKNIEIVNDLTSTRIIRIELSNGNIILYPGESTNLLINNGKVFRSKQGIDWCQARRRVSQTLSFNNFIIFDANRFGGGGSVKLNPDNSSFTLLPGDYEVLGLFRINQGATGASTNMIIDLYDITNNVYLDVYGANPYTVDFNFSISSAPVLSGIVTINQTSTVRLRLTSLFGASVIMRDAIFTIKRIN